MRTRFAYTVIALTVCLSASMAGAASETVGTKQNKPQITNKAQCVKLKEAERKKCLEEGNFPTDCEDAFKKGVKLCEGLFEPAPPQ